MPIHSRMKCLLATLLVAFVISGCQSSNNKWTTAWKERTKPKPQFQGLEGSEEVTYWPYKPSKDKKKMTAIPSQLKEKLARNSEQSKSTKQQTELIKEGDQLRKNGQYEDARLVYSKALLLSPESPEVNHRLAIIADKQHHYSTADQYYQAALRVRPQDVNLLSDLGYSYSLRGNALQAEQTLKDALVIDKTHKGAMLNLGSLYSQQNRYPEALEMFRSGATEAEAQQYIAKLFPQGRAVGDSIARADRAIADRGNSTASLAIGSAPPDSAPDISKMSFEQIQTEMARRKQDAKLRRQQEAQQEHLRIQNLASETERFEQLQAQQQRLAQLNPRGGTAGGPMTLGPQSGSDPVYSKNQPGGEMSQRQTEMLLPGSNSQAQVMNVPFGAPSNNATPQDRSLRSAQGAGAPSNTEFFLGSPGQTQPQRQTDSQIQQAWGQRLGTATNNDQQINGSNPASQMATQLGMSAGPGNMFPIMLGSHATSSVNDGAIPAGLSNSQASGFGGGFAQPSNSPNSQSWSGNQVEPPSNATQKNDGFDSIAPLSCYGRYGHTNKSSTVPIRMHNKVIHSHHHTLQLIRLLVPTACSLRVRHFWAVRRRIQKNTFTKRIGYVYKLTKESQRGFYCLSSIIIFRFTIS